LQNIQEDNTRQWAKYFRYYRPIQCSNQTDF